MKIWDLRFRVRGEFQDRTIWIMARTPEAALYKGRRYLRRLFKVYSIDQLTEVGKVDVQ